MGSQGRPGDLLGAEIRIRMFDFVNKHREIQGNRQYIASATVNSTVYILAILVQVILCNPGSDSDLDHHCISGKGDTSRHSPDGVSAPLTTEVIRS